MALTERSVKKNTKRCRTFPGITGYFDISMIQSFIKTIIKS